VNSININKLRSNEINTLVGHLIFEEACLLLQGVTIGSSQLNALPKNNIIFKKQ